MQYFAIQCVIVIDAEMQSRRQSSRLRGTKRLSGGEGGAEFEIRHKSHCFQKN